MNCIEKCKHGAISYKYHPFGKPAAGKADSEQINETRRSFSQQRLWLQPLLF